MDGEFPCILQGVLSLMCSALLILYTERTQMEILSNVSVKNIFSTLRDGIRWMLGFSSAIAPLSETVIGQFFIYYSIACLIFQQLTILLILLGLSPNNMFDITMIVYEMILKPIA